MTGRAVTLGKESNFNEDAVLATESMIAVSDGAGGGGLFADKWSQFLLNKLPMTPLKSFEDFDKWVDGIWEEFYTVQEAEALKLDALTLDKFYSEGSFATIAAVWYCNDSIQWLTYGDSVVFCYDIETHELISTVNSLKDFNEAPYLVSTNEPLKANGFKRGTFAISPSKIYFCASDALSFYIMTTYLAWKEGEISQQIKQVLSCKSKNANFAYKILSEKFDFESDVLNKLLRASRNRHNFTLHLNRLYKKGIIASDDYSICFMLP